MPNTPHTLEDFELELQSIRGAVLSMASLAQEMVDAVGRLLSHDKKPSASKAKQHEKNLDQLEAEVDQQARIIITRYQPVATDLREVTGGVRMATDFEQIGDDARRILLHAKELKAWIAYDAKGVLEAQWKLSTKLLSDACEAFNSHDAEQGTAIGDSKSKVRKLASDSRDIISKSVEQNHSLAPAFVEAVNAIHALENIGLHACSLGEAVVFIETSTDRRDRRSREE
ncbi:MAG: PhoU domain-containing protein [Verrucomicrobiales bacterium]|nr:PhoU domain-containing protein [Verrucomicrobiales bacterium]